MITLSLGCGLNLEPSKDDGGTFTKDDARQDQPLNPGIDYCDLNDWYGDGVCDDFCLQPDPDCNSTCLAEAVCPSGTVIVEACPPDASCEEVTVCGSTITCMHEEICAAIAPDCGPNAIQVDFCDPDDSTCTVFEIPCSDDGVMYCEEVSNCEAFPSCPVGFIQVEACPFDAECLVTELCGYEIMCMPEEIQCDAIPVCPRGAVEVDVCPEDGNCFEQSMCGDTILCHDQNANCLAVPVCPDGSKQVEACAPDTSCFEEYMCGITITCEREFQICNAAPVCPPDTMPVMGCSVTDPNCFELTICGNTIGCAF